MLGLPFLDECHGRRRAPVRDGAKRDAAAAAGGAGASNRGEKGGKVMNATLQSLRALNPSLKYLQREDRGGGGVFDMSDDPPGVEDLPAACMIIRNGKYTSVNLGACTVPGECGRLLFEAVEHNANIMHVDLGDCKIHRRWRGMIEGVVSIRRCRDGGDDDDNETASAVNTTTTATTTATGARSPAAALRSPSPRRGAAGAARAGRTPRPSPRRGSKPRHDSQPPPVDMHAYQVVGYECGSLGMLCRAIRELRSDAATDTVDLRNSATLSQASAALIYRTLLKNRHIMTVDMDGCQIDPAERDRIDALMEDRRQRREEEEALAAQRAAEAPPRSRAVSLAASSPVASARGPPTAPQSPSQRRAKHKAADAAAAAGDGSEDDASASASSDSDDADASDKETPVKEGDGGGSDDDDDDDDASTRTPLPVKGVIRFVASDSPRLLSLPHLWGCRRGVATSPSRSRSPQRSPSPPGDEDLAATGSPPAPHHPLHTLHGKRRRAGGALYEHMDARYGSRVMTRHERTETNDRQRLEFLEACGREELQKTQHALQRQHRVWLRRRDVLEHVALVLDALQQDEMHQRPRIEGAARRATAKLLETAESLARGVTEEDERDARGVMAKAARDEASLASLRLSQRLATYRTTQAAFMVEEQQARSAVTIAMLTERSAVLNEMAEDKAEKRAEAQELQKREEDERRRQRQRIADAEREKEHLAEVEKQHTRDAETERTAQQLKFQSQEEKARGVISSSSHKSKEAQLRNCLDMYQRVGLELATARVRLGSAIRALEELLCEPPELTLRSDSKTPTPVHFYNAPTFISLNKALTVACAMPEDWATRIAKAEAAIVKETMQLEKAYATYRRQVEKLCTSVEERVDNAIKMERPKWLVAMRKEVTAQLYEADPLAHFKTPDIPAITDLKLKIWGGSVVMTTKSAEEAVRGASGSVCASPVDTPRSVTPGTPRLNREQRQANAGARRPSHSPQGILEYSGGGSEPPSPARSLSMSQSQSRSIGGCALARHEVEVTTDYIKYSEDNGGVVVLVPTDGTSTVTDLNCILSSVAFRHQSMLGATDPLSVTTPGSCDGRRQSLTRRRTGRSFRKANAPRMVYLVSEVQLVVSTSNRFDAPDQFVMLRQTIETPLILQAQYFRLETSPDFTYEEGTDERQLIDSPIVTENPVSTQRQPEGHFVLSQNKSTYADYTLAVTLKNYSKDDQVYIKRKPEILWMEGNRVLHKGQHIGSVIEGTFRRYAPAQPDAKLSKAALKQQQQDLGTRPPGPVQRIRLTEAARGEELQAILECLYFINNSSDPVEGKVTLDEPTERHRCTQTVQIAIKAEDDPAVISIKDKRLSFHAACHMDMPEQFQSRMHPNCLQIAGTATIKDVDTVYFTGGYMRFRISSGYRRGDRLFIQAPKQSSATCMLHQYPLFSTSPYATHTCRFEEHVLTKLGYSADRAENHRASTSLRSAESSPEIHCYQLDGIDQYRRLQVWYGDDVFGVATLLSPGSEEDPPASSRSGACVSSEVQEIVLHFAELPNGVATIPAAEAFLRSISFGSSYLTPREGPRTIDIAIQLGSNVVVRETFNGHAVRPAEYNPNREFTERVTVVVTPGLLRLPSRFAETAYMEGSGLKKIAPLEVLDDEFGPENYAGGKVRVEIIQGGYPEDFITMKDLTCTNGGETMEFEVVASAPLASTLQRDVQQTISSKSLLPGSVDEEKDADAVSVGSEELFDVDNDRITVWDVMQMGAAREDEDGHVVPLTDLRDGTSSPSNEEDGEGSSSSDGGGGGGLVVATPRSARSDTASHVQAVKPRHYDEDAFVHEPELPLRHELHGLDAVISIQKLQRYTERAPERAHEKAHRAIADRLLTQNSVAEELERARVKSFVVKKPDETIARVEVLDRLLKITFNKDVAVRRKDVNIILRNIAYLNTSDNPKNSKRIFLFTLSGGSHYSTPSTAFVRLSIASFDNPTSALLTTDRWKYRQFATTPGYPMALFPLGHSCLDDPDTNDFRGGSISLECHGFNAKTDRLVLMNPVHQRRQVQRFNTILAPRFGLPPINPPILFQTPDEVDERQQLVRVGGPTGHVIARMVLPQTGSVGMTFLLEPPTPDRPRISLAMMSYLFNCLAYYNGTLPPHPEKPHSKMIRVRISDGSNPDDGKSSLSIDYYGPLIQFPNAMDMEHFISPSCSTTQVIAAKAIVCLPDKVLLTRGYLEAMMLGDSILPSEHVFLNTQKLSGYMLRDGALFFNGEYIGRLHTYRKTWFRLDFKKPERGAAKGVERKRLQEVIRLISYRTSAPDNDEYNPTKYPLFAPSERQEQQRVELVDAFPPPTGDTHVVLIRCSDGDEDQEGEPETSTLKCVFNYGGKSAQDARAKELKEAEELEKQKLPTLWPEVPPVAAPPPPSPMTQAAQQAKAGGAGVRSPPDKPLAKRGKK